MALSRIIRSTAIVSSFLAVITAEASEPAKTEVIVSTATVFHWASNPAVQDELRLSMEQREQLKILTKEYRAATDPSKKRGEVPPDERDAWDAEQRKAHEKAHRDFRPKFDKLLSAEQHTRLGEIYIQALIWLNGPAGAGRQEIAQAIGLTDDQRKMLRQIEYDWLRTISELKLLATEQERAARQQADLQKRNEASDAVLTPEQKKRLTELSGKPFDIPGALAHFPNPAWKK